MPNTAPNHTRQITKWISLWLSFYIKLHIQTFIVAKIDAVTYHPVIHNWQSNSSWEPPACFVSSIFTERGTRLGDLNRDGLMDIIWARGCNEPPDYMNAYINNGNGWDENGNWYPPLCFAYLLGVAYPVCSPAGYPFLPTPHTGNRAAWALTGPCIG